MKKRPGFAHLKNLFYLDRRRQPTMFICFILIKISLLIKKFKCILKLRFWNCKSSDGSIQCDQMAIGYFLIFWHFQQWEFGGAAMLSGFVCTFHPAAPGLTPKHTIYAFIINSQICSIFVIAMWEKN